MLTLDDVLSIRHTELPRWSPDGRWVAFVWHVDGVREVRAQRAEGGDGEPVRLSPAGRAAGAWDWSPTGALAVAAGDEIFLARPTADGSGFREPAPCLSGVRPVRGLRWSPVEERLLVARGDVLLFLGEGPDVREVALPGPTDGDLAWSPDGRQVAFAFREEGRVDLAVLDAATGEIVWRTRTAEAEGAPVWLGSRLVFARSDPGSLWYEWVVADVATGVEEVWLREEDRRGVWPGVRAAASPTGSSST